MTMPAEGDRSLTLMKRALAEIRELRDKVHAYEEAAHEPIAVVGMGCRFPAGVNDPEALWQFFLDGRDAIEDLPASRDLLQPVAGDARPRGSFLQDIDRFDAPFFEISAREANSMDPQQRLLLEVSWETLEHADIRPSTLRGSRTGVYVGVMTTEYSELIRDAGEIDLHSATGGAPSVIAGRLSHFYGLHGPALIVDTACSSSLASIHLACQALRQRECDQAFAAGLNLLLSARAYEAERRAGMLAADGRCKTFDARADGIGRGEGVGVVLLKRLSDAVAARNSIVAVIRGSAMNHDGRSSGMTTPNERAQERVLQDALANARVAPRDVGFIEAHGTGTSLGDPVELGALATIFGGDRTVDRPLLVGAAKASFGHLEGAAGILGFMKAALAVRHGEVPGQLHIEQLNPLIPWAQIPMTVPTSRQPYPPSEGPRVAGVSSFGLSGTNVHVVIAEPPPVAKAAHAPAAARPAHLLTFSARTAEALHAMDAQLRRRVRELSPARIGDLCHTVNTRRDRFEHRRAMVFSASSSEPEYVVSGIATDPVAAHDVLPSGNWRQYFRGAADAYVRGAALDWEQIDAGFHFERVPAPTYPFEDRRYWLSARAQSTASPPLRLTRRPVAIAASTQSVFECALDATSYLRDHRVYGSVVLPAAAFVDLGLQIARALRDDGPLTVRNVSIIRPLILDAADGETTLQAVTEQIRDVIRWQIFRLRADTWTLHAEGEIGAPLAWFAPVVEPRLEALQADHREPIDLGDFYDRCAAHGLEYGPAFRSLAAMWRGAAGALARIEVPFHQREDVADPVALDGCLQMLGALFAATPGEAPLLPAGIDTFSLLRPLPKIVWCAATPRRQTARDSDERVVDLELLDEAGALLATASGVLLRRAAPGSFEREIALRVPVWEPLDPAPAVPPSSDDSCVVVRAAGPENDVRALDAAPDPLRGVVYHATDAAGLLNVVKALIDRRRADGFRLCIVTRGAQEVTAAGPPVDVWQAPIWGLARVALLEHPELNCRIIDLEAGVEPIPDALVCELAATDREEQIAYRAGRRYGLRLREVPDSDPAPTPQVDGESSYLITGGLGALGLHVAEWLVTRGARHLTLMGRSAASAEAVRAIGALRERGADVRVSRGDVSREQDIARALREAEAHGAPLKGVVHAAGVLDDRVLAQTTWESCQRVFAPKVDGAWNLHRATRDRDLAFFICFSSAASILGSPGQGNYAAANEFLDALAHHRRRLGLPGLSINWGPWAGAGMAAGAAAADYLTPLSVPRALDALERSLAAGAPQVAVLPFTPRFDAEFASSTRAPRLLTELARPRVATPRAITPVANEDARTVALRVVGGVLGRSLSAADMGISLARLGMDSLMALEIRDGLRQQLGVALSVVDILKMPSVNELATMLNRLLVPSAVSGAQAEAAGGADVWPTSHGQRSLWFLHGLDPQSSAYHVAFVARVRSAIDARALEETFNVLAHRHPVLGSQFGLEDGALVCRPRPDRRVAFGVVDASGLDDASLANHVRAAYAKPFDLAAGDAPFRVTLITRAADDHVLLTTAHHIVHDAWSMWVIAEELRHIYPALRAGRTPQLPPQTRPFADAVREEQARLAEPGAERLWEFWRGELSGSLPVLDLPADHQRPSRRTTRGATRAFELPAALTASLRELAGREGATVFNVLLAGFQSLLHRYSGQDDLVVGVPMNGRETPGFERTVGYFVNPVPVRSRVTRGTTFRELLAETRGRALGAMAHQGLPFPVLVDKLQTAHEPSRTPVFQTLFVFQQPQEALELSAIDSASGTTDWGGLRLEAYAELQQQEGQFDLTLELVDRGERIAGAWKYSLDLFEGETAVRMLEYLQNLLAAALANPDAPVRELDILSAVERRTIVSTWNATARPYDLETSLPRLLEAQAERTPDAIAVVFEEQTLTYRALDEHATRLATALRARGARRAMSSACRSRGHWSS
nr:Beta-ketoacyl synthase [uncultured bacterium]